MIIKIRYIRFIKIDFVKRIEYMIILDYIFEFNNYCNKVKIYEIVFFGVCFEDIG